MLHPRLLILFAIVLSLSSCEEQFFVQNSRYSNTEWIVYEWQGTASSHFECDDWNYQGNTILDELAGLYDTSDDLTELRFYHDNTFAIVRDGRIRLRGDVDFYSDQIVLRSYSDRLVFEIMNERSNTLVLYTPGYDDFRDVEMTLKRL